MEGVRLRAVAELPLHPAVVRALRLRVTARAVPAAVPLSLAHRFFRDPITGRPRLEAADVCSAISFQLSAIMSGRYRNRYRNRHRYRYRLLHPDFQ